MGVGWGWGGGGGNRPIMTKIAKIHRKTKTKNKIKFLFFAFFPKSEKASSFKMIIILQLVHANIYFTLTCILLNKILMTMVHYFFFNGGGVP